MNSRIQNTSLPLFTMAFGFFWMFNLSPVFAANQIWVSRPTTAVGCKSNPADSLAEGQAKLQAAGVKVSKSKNIDHGVVVAMACGANLPADDAYEISSTQLPEATTAGFKKLIPRSKAPHPKIRAKH